MKKQLLSIFSLLIAGTSFSQVIFSENFDSGMPSTWTLHNVDGLTPANHVNFVNNAWVAPTSLAAMPSFAKTAISTSWYNPAGRADDWLVSPAVTLPATGNIGLSFDAVSADNQFKDGFKVYISTTGTSVVDFGTTPVLTVNEVPAEVTSYFVDLTDYLGQTIYFAIRNDSDDKLLLSVDNIVIKNFSIDDVELVSTRIDEFCVINTNNTLSARVKNLGFNTITSLQLTWDDGNGVQTANITTNIAPLQVVSVNHTIPVNSSIVGVKNFDIKITQVNGVNDTDTTNNEGINNTIFVSKSGDKKVLFEVGTGTWCQWCPRGHVATKNMSTAYPDKFIGIAVHNQDPMANTAYDIASDFDGYPDAHADRYYRNIEVSQNVFQLAYNLRKDLVTPFDVAADFTSNGNNVSIKASATYYSNNTSANYRLGAIIIEDGVKGTDAGYNQSNGFAGGANGPMGGYESLPNPVPASQMVYDHVARALLGGYNGQSGSIPASLTDEQTVEYTFNYTVPSTSKKNNMSVVVVVIDQTTGAIVNATKKSLATASVDNNIETLDLAIFPNPATDKITVSFEAKGGEYQIEITDLQGRTVQSANFSNLSGSQAIELNTSDLVPGNYLLTVAQDGASFAKMIAIK